MNNGWLLVDALILGVLVGLILWIIIDKVRRRG